MIGVISGLVAVVLLVLMVVALGMRSMNRRESALSAERIKAMAENKGPKPRRPAEETFFESFPQGFDAFEEPAERAKPQRSGPARQGGRQARPAKGGGNKQPAPAAARGRRGVDEWGEHDDYDDDYWSRVRADDGGFGGTIAARPATPRPVEQSAGAGVTADPDAATVQAPLPQRQARAGLADLVGTSRAAAETPRRPAKPAPTSPPTPTPTATPASALADQQTVTFSAPTPPDALGTTPSRSRSGRAGGSRPSRSASRRAAAAEPGRTSGSFEAASMATPAPTGTPSPIPTTGAFSTGSYEGVRGTGPFEATPGASAPGVSPPGASAPAAPAAASASAESWSTAYEPTAYESPRSDAYDLSRNATGPFSPADTGPSYPVNPAASTPADSALPPSTPGSTTSPGWPAVRDVLDDPEPPRVSNSWPAVESYQSPTAQSPSAYSPSAQPPSAYDDYSATAVPGGPAGYGSVPSTPSSYEVSAGWATIDDADTVTEASPSPAASPYESAGYDVPSGQSYYGYDQQQGEYGSGQPSSWSEQNTGGNWSSQDELSGEEPKSTSARRGSHRSDPETEYPDYYR